MNNPLRRLLPLAGALLLPVVACAQAGVAESQDYLREAAAAREAGDDAGVIRALERAHELNPASLFTRYNLARAYAKAGRHGDALAKLEGLVRQRMDFGMGEDSELEVLYHDPRFRQLVDELAATVTPVAVSRLRHEAPRIDLVAEGIAWDPGGERLFFGSMRTGEVFVFDRDGQQSKFAAVADHAPLAAIGMTVDRERGLLWVVGTAFFLTEGYDADAPAVSGVFAFDLDSGEERHRYLRDDVEHGYNDVALAPDGTVYLSGAFIGRLAPGPDAHIETVETDKPVFGSNGIVVTRDGERLITSAYPAGLATIELATGTTRFLDAPADVSLYGIDGLYLHDGDLVGVQNGARPWRLMRFELDPGLTAVTSARAIEFGHESVATTGAIVGDEIHWIAQAPAVERPPAHLPGILHQYLGRTQIFTAPLD